MQADMADPPDNLEREAEAAQVKLVIQVLVMWEAPEEMEQQARSWTALQDIMAEAAGDGAIQLQFPAAAKGAEVTAALTVQLRLRTARQIRAAEAGVHGINLMATLAEPAVPVS